jgi:hypothetical protein
VVRFSTAARDFSILQNAHTRSGVNQPERNSDNHRVVPKLILMEFYLHFHVPLHGVHGDNFAVTLRYFTDVL